MDLSASSISAYQLSQTQSQVQFSVAAKVLNLAREEGSAAIELLQSAGGRGAGPGDPLTAAATGLGRQVDAYA